MSHLNQRTLDPAQKKSCAKCGAGKLLSAFSKCKASRDGLQPKCKVCCSVYNAARYAANPEPKKAASAARYAADPGRENAASAARYAANPERKRAREVARYAANPERHKAVMSAWVKANPEKVRIIQHNRRARKREVGGRLSPSLPARLFELQQGKCACCGHPLAGKYHLDHIMPILLGGTNTDDNIQLLHQRCNNQKHAKHPVEFMQSRGFLL